jgi:xanthine dehydrogenase YagR molybdenum-binding subunit
MNDAAPTPGPNMGEPQPRIDGRLKVTGSAPYAADVPLKNLAHAVLVTSDVAKGKAISVDVNRAKAVRDVIDVITYGDVGSLQRPRFGNASSTSLGPLHEQQIFHDGQIVAIVVANTLIAAEQAARAIEIKYQPEKPSASLDSPGTESLAAKGRARMVADNPKRGDFAQAFAAAPVKLDAQYDTPTQHHNPIELFSTTAVWEDGKLTVYEPSQNVYGFRGELAHQLQMDPSDIRVVSEYVGGGFGSKGPMTPRTALVALAARRVNRPVRCVVTRMQGFTTITYRAPTRHRIKIGATRDGKITAFSHEGWELTSRMDDYAVGGTSTTTRMYNYGTVLSDVTLVKTDRQTPGYMRSPPETPYVYALESAIDEMAEKLGMDPIELRRLNDTQVEPIGGKPFTSRSLMQCFDAAAKAFNWSARNPQPKSMREGDWLIGYGCAMAVYPTHVGAAAARVRLNSEGKVLVQCASHEIGTGIRTVAAQMAAEELGVPYESVSVETGDTRLPPAPVSGGSNSTASVCSTVKKACAQIRERLSAVVDQKTGPLAGAKKTDLKLRDGKLVARDASQPLKDVFKALGTGVIEEYAEFVPEEVAPDAVQQLYGGKSSMTGGAEGEKHVMFAFGAEFVEVRVHALTREIRVPRMVGAFAGGRIMNTRTARSQLMGGMIWGMSSALLEATEVDERNARYVNRDLAEYLVPVNADVPSVEVILVPEVDDKVNPAGVKGLGELGNVGTAAAVAAAVYHATGKRIRDLPIRADKLLDI